jgi:tripartite-type tricarboxylate transporter receptor subunit TctC
MPIARRLFLRLTGAAITAAAPGVARADIYPSRVVRLLVGFPPGGGADLAARIVVSGLSDFLGPAGHCREQAGRRRAARA